MVIVVVGVGGDMGVGVDVGMGVGIGISIGVVVTVVVVVVVVVGRGCVVDRGGYVRDIRSIMLHVPSLTKLGFCLSFFGFYLL